LRTQRCSFTQGSTRWPRRGAVGGRRRSARIGSRVGDHDGGAGD
jgi:hypothetical protein